MKAVIFEKIGGPEVIRVVNVEAKHPGPGKVRVKMEASGLNYSDLLIRTGQYPDPFRAPYYVGREIAGAIDAVGEGVGSFSIGQKVFGMVAEGGTMAELPVVPAHALFPLPEQLPPAVAASVPVQGAAAMLSLVDCGKVQEGDTVLVHSAAGGVGGLAVQIARALGAKKVIGTTSRDDKLDEIRGLGAEAVNYTRKDWVDQVLESTSGKGADVIIESIGGQVFKDSWRRASAHGGRIVIIGLATGPVEVNTGELLFTHRQLIGFNLGSFFPDRAQEVGASVERLMGWVAEGKVKIRVGHTFPLDRAREAFALMEERKNLGKIIVTP